MIMMMIKNFLEIRIMNQDIFNVDADDEEDEDVDDDEIKDCCPQLMELFLRNNFLCFIRRF